MPRIRPSSRAWSTEGRLVAGRRLILWAAVLCCSCRPDLSTFYDRLYSCDTTVAGANCGKNLQGEPMMCFAARQLGAQDFCTDSCDGDSLTSSEDSICLESHARLDSCQPSDDADLVNHPHGACGRPELSCLRTDLLKDEGVCTTAKLCKTDVDCRDPARSTCASSILYSLYHAVPGLKIDHLYCVQVGCRANGSNCLPGESCLPNVLHGASLPPDICVPTCDSGGNCPPNYQCYQKVSGPPSPAVCIPVLLGYRCLSRIDCLVGDCVDTGDQFHVCSVPCQSEQDCTGFDSARGIFHCVSPTGDGSRYCMTGESFKGSLCRRDADCATGKICAFYSPYMTDLDFGSCLPPCASDGTCGARGGVSQNCVGQDVLQTPVCYPAEFGIPCESVSDCTGDLQCLPAPELGAMDERTTVSLCTIACATDADCRANRNTSRGWCSEGVCVLPQVGDRLCQRPSECASGVCRPSERFADQGKTLSRCTFPAGGS